MTGIAHVVDAAIALRLAAKGPRASGAALKLLAAVERLDVERGVHLNARMFQHGMYRLEVAEDPGDSLEDDDLLDMVLAARMVRATEDATPIVPGQGRTISTVCDDRMVAALYTLYHYDAVPSIHDAEPIASLPRRVLVQPLTTSDE